MLNRIKTFFTCTHSFWACFGFEDSRSDPDFCLIRTKKHPDPKHCFRETEPLELNNSFRVSTPTVNFDNSHVQGGELYTSIYKCKAVIRQGQADKKKSPSPTSHCRHSSLISWVQTVLNSVLHCFFTSVLHCRSFSVTQRCLVTSLHTCATVGRLKETIWGFSKRRL